MSDCVWIVTVGQDHEEEGIQGVYWQKDKALDAVEKLRKQSTRTMKLEDETPKRIFWHDGLHWIELQRHEVLS